MSDKQLWAEPKIKIGKTFYVWFRFYNAATGKKELIIKKGGANAAGLTKVQIRQSLTALQKAIKYKLKVKDWNPITNTYPYHDPELEAVAEMEMELEILQKMSFYEALEWSYKKKKPDWGKRSFHDYKSTKKYLLEAAFELGIYHRKIIE